MLRNFQSALIIFWAVAGAASGQRAGGGLAGGGGMAGGGGGVHIDADGVLRIATMPSQATKKPPRLSQSLARRADLRRISLRQLDAQLRLAKDSNGDLPDDLRYLAGLNKIEYVAFDQAAKDVYLAGPAEGWKFAADGRAVGVSSKRPAIPIENLAAALRCVLTGRGAIDCSIDPTREGLAKIRRLAPEGINNKQVADGFRATVLDQFGLQTVRSNGVPNDSLFARTMVEADYRMKRMALGAEKFPGLNSHLDTLASLAETGARQFNLARWWFTPEYEPVAVSDDGAVYQIRGRALKLLNEEVLFDESGNRSGTGRTTAEWDRFCRSFNKLLPTMEGKVLPFADLHNLFDLMLAAGLIRHLGHGDWLDSSALLDDSIYALPRYSAAKMAEPVVGYNLDKNMQQRRYIFTFTYGGVTMNPRAVLNSGFAKGGGVSPGIAIGVDAQGLANQTRSVRDANAVGKDKAVESLRSNDSTGSNGNWWQDFERPRNGD